MSTGYVFHCTPCGHPHAGECPPKDTGSEHSWQPLPIVDFNNKQRCTRCGALWQVSLMSMTAAIVDGIPAVPPKGPCPGIPKVGSLWKVEVKALRGWALLRDSYEVTSAEGALMEVMPLLPGTRQTYKVPIGAWTEDGAVDWSKLFSGTKIRFVPAGT